MKKKKPEKILSTPRTGQKNQAVTFAIEQIQKQFGRGSIMRLGEGPVAEVPVIKTGILPLDVALGIGGIPKGRIAEIYGPESSGKTTVCLSIIAEAQKAGGVAAFIDAEHALDPAWAKKLGVKLDDLLVAQPDNGEQALEITESLVRSGGVDLLVVDSVAALVPRSEIEGEMGDAQIGLQARLMSQALRKLTGIVSKSQTTIIFTNQIRLKIGIMFGNPETTSGGMALKFYASVRCDVRKIETLKKNNEAYGTRVRVKVVKNKMAPPFQEAQFIITGDGIDRDDAIVESAIQAGVVTKAGSFLRLGEKMIGQGKEQVKELLQKDDKLRAQMLSEISKKLNGKK
ncbi:recombinase RecA [Candidatus Roizmanbacteria bacterium RIFCSPLOWO2_12_FULL_40_12]|uniref:Protein RecA n=1 Tax=Candidatus Roizmanbacteria bacterium RIFCSPLOWO2_01_FULL_40_42 TaxID=1802066 RepID=A0A1F7J2G0_9BACT|nr:MAG: recombinase RecA [Candidatus Roizmanbacteria bacterium RIFCSPHIGHO2_01_FULL_40_98]OGK28605.1 MAG: recombinase RecA [Candidatus Roizmanbacteria bacterium RIFCSPHIGHO2_02_FULL_40_53]OGK29883.1 MAG: recombinase RecA [Candidatus Roizmanbacteria bacterium RIFCSPHIGHO2_12_41_18]OGK36753.1 MAG: recombinase RecA [Candidatus Roizmanbacteria bacterium RIFCSPHIGHO2_12_FULL_40_130]OGK49802.1 MAG: recombinase RecA [Candidatus Roizmanbacteria bacterium RIFCSPLOWO2_01_FULL_40_42]OGK58852.1 MAG: recom